jgi:hypothetical protein
VFYDGVADDVVERIVWKRQCARVALAERTAKFGVVAFIHERMCLRESGDTTFDDIVRLDATPLTGARPHKENSAARWNTFPQPTDFLFT